MWDVSLSPSPLGTSHVRSLSPSAVFFHSSLSMSFTLSVLIFLGQASFLSRPHAVAYRCSVLQWERGLRLYCAPTVLHFNCWLALTLFCPSHDCQCLAASPDCGVTTKTKPFHQLLYCLNPVWILDINDKMYINTLSSKIQCRVRQCGTIGCNMTLCDSLLH